MNKHNKIDLVIQWAREEGYAVFWWITDGSDVIRILPTLGDSHALIDLDHHCFIVNDEETEIPHYGDPNFFASLRNVLNSFFKDTDPLSLPSRVRAYYHKRGKSDIDALTLADVTDIVMLFLIAFVTKLIIASTIMPLKYAMFPIFIIAMLSFVFITMFISFNRSPLRALRSKP